MSYSVLDTSGNWALSLPCVIFKEYVPQPKSRKCPVGRGFAMGAVEYVPRPLRFGRGWQFSVYAKTFRLSAAYLIQ